MKTWVVIGEHFEVPGRSVSTHFSEEAAEAEALSLVRIMLTDAGRKKGATSQNWKEQIEMLRKSGRDCDVEIVETDTKPIKKFRVRLEEIVNYTVEVHVASKEEALEIAPEIWAQSENPTNDFEGASVGVEVKWAEELS